MKVLFVISSIFVTLSTMAKREIHCVVNDVYAPYSDILLKQTKGNKYKMETFSQENLLLEDTVSYTFSRRARVTTFSSKNSKINAVGLVYNKGVRSQFTIPEISKLPYNGLCKLYKK
ncbi:hypothetical protein [Halobacteriovorax sp. JY17]|uniref:hypothetical protein n=1 Tax=Halobacteriovorax sp. JY17 TaxID=2014617 RepID=UPI000C533707|nr:hypothetical protein [Halobacteriovorax sp. JY17]PIK14136.1 MAG: hypothetical protein CES88_14230 [Halobacteriovorax sp. JY17]